MNVFQGDKEKMIRNLQRNLKLVRSAAGWNQQELADLIGVSRQTINNIENQKSPMSPTQYVAIAAMLDLRQKEKPGLNNVIEAVLMMEDDDQPSEEPNFTIIDKNGNPSENGRPKLSDAMAEARSSVVKAADVGKAAGAVAGAALGAIGGPIGMVAGSLLGGWLSTTKKK